MSKYDKLMNDCGLSATWFMETENLKTKALDDALEPKYVD